MGAREDLRLLCWNLLAEGLVIGVDVLEAIRSRRSVRAFKNKNVSSEDVAMLIDSAHWAPSAGNIQPWEFVIIRKKDVKKQLADAALSQSFIAKAPVLVVVCANENRSSQGYGVRGKTLYCIQDTAAAIQNIHLAAFSLGLGTCWVGAFSEEEVAKVLKLPHGIRPVAIVPVGYALGPPERPERKPVNGFVHDETF
jgi:nitroreductase